MAVPEELGDPGGWLIHRRGSMDGSEAEWLEVLGRFDSDEAWAGDGQLSGAGWLMARCGMARSTAYEKLRLARELRRREVVGNAFRAGEISYSAARAICSLDDTDADTDAVLVELARTNPITDVEAAVRYYQTQHAQHFGGGLESPEFRQVHTGKGLWGLGDIRARVENDVVELFEATLRLYCERQERFAAESAAADNGAVGGSESAAADNGAVGGSESAAADDGAVGESESAAADNGAVGGSESAAADNGGGLSPVEELDWRYSYGQRRADALAEMLSTALAHVDDGQAVGSDRYLVHLVADLDGLRGRVGGRAELVDGSVLPAGAAARMACDASFVGHILDGTEPLYLGRRVRDWTSAQRRAITVRDQAVCRFPGCERRLVDVHHVVPWEDGGPTDIANGILLCRRHHTLVHAGFLAEGNANEKVSFRRRTDGSTVGTSSPPTVSSSLFSTY
ncbi:MAG TPA: DUF222 domain-containing protein [Acidimicrobiales bacterium]|nr:DUF222 domain-containing protein [Acidimicrobiales bacterium]